jgi:hypothetical protein
LYLTPPLSGKFTFHGKAADEMRITLFQILQIKENKYCCSKQKNSSNFESLVTNCRGIDMAREPPVAPNRFKTWRSIATLVGDQNRNSFGKVVTGG